jgi:adenylylsulfate kinase-like enzyme
MKPDRIPSPSIRIRSNDPMTQSSAHTLWLTGLSGAGKSTLATEVAARLRDRALPAPAFLPRPNGAA